MTESESISWLKTLKRMYRAYPSEVIKAWDVAIEALEEVQKYRAIGTGKKYDLLSPIYEFAPRGAGSVRTQEIVSCGI